MQKLLLNLSFILLANELVYPNSWFYDKNRGYVNHEDQKFIKKKHTQYNEPKLVTVLASETNQDKIPQKLKASHLKKFLKKYDIYNAKQMLKVGIPEGQLTTVQRNCVGYIQKIYVGNPTEENTGLYQKVKFNAFKKGDSVGKAELLYNLQNPKWNMDRISPNLGLARKEYNLRLEQEKVNLIKRLKPRYELVYILQSNCSVCKVSSPIIKAFAAKHHWELVPISVNGAATKDFPNVEYLPQLVNKIASKGPIYLPALFLMDLKTEQFIPVINGSVMAIDQIEDNLALRFGVMK